MESGETGRAEEREGQCTSHTSGRVRGTPSLPLSARQFTIAVMTVDFVVGWSWAISSPLCIMSSASDYPTGLLQDQMT